MENSLILRREVAVSIHPGSVVLHGLREMKKLGDSMLLIAEGNKTQILVNRGCSYAMLDMRAYEPSNFDGYALRFSLDTLLQRIAHPIERVPSTSVNFSKDAGSRNLHCRLGNSMRNAADVDLGEAEFCRTEGIMTGGNPFKVRVTMKSDYFRDFIEAFKRVHEHIISAIRMGISGAFLRWIPPSGQHFSRPAQGCAIEGVEEGKEILFRMIWNETLFRMLCSASTRYESVVLTVFHDSREMEWYQFRFIIPGQTYSFCYIETLKRPCDRLEEANL